MDVFRSPLTLVLEGLKNKFLLKFVASWYVSVQEMLDTHGSLNMYSR